VARGLIVDRFTADFPSSGSPPFYAKIERLASGCAGVGSRLPIGFRL
jgi:hypothetical protein